EAMACGCPVVTSAGTVLEEVAAGAAVLADPYDPAALAAACSRLLAERAERERLVTAGLERAAVLTWESTARLTLAAWTEMA
ncbi:MAG: glycosyltransferase, partial [Candidatus Dormibacteria bacterium]